MTRSRELPRLEIPEHRRQDWSALRAQRNSPEASMARYYFHLTDGKQVLTTHEGVDLPGNAAAREEALRFAGELKNGKTMPDRNWDDWFVTIVNQHGHKVDMIPMAAVAGKPRFT